MKYYFLIILLLTSTTILLSQSKIQEEEELFFCDMTYVGPRYPGGTSAMKNFIASNFTIPTSYLDTVSTFGEKKMEIRFAILESGKSCCFEVKKSISPILDTEAIRILKLMPDWKPAIEKGKFKKTYHNQPITIIIEAEDSAHECVDSLLFVKRNTTPPATAIKLPHKANHPVEINKNIQIPIEMITGTGNNHILKGNPPVPNFLRSNITPTPCAMNWTTMRMARMALITSDILNNRLNTKPNPHNTSNET
jgi:hypothetical protein